jgi:hypothetical protein
MVQIIPKDIHIRKWEKFQVDVQLKFLTWSFLFWLIGQQNRSTSNQDKLSKMGLICGP